ncbi:hypothetical protein KAI92_03370 [Candidatus Parcubacteria bacterium]|nr:hypothetical protein [Candidatus Parcubacteria bacterium]
MQNKIQDTNQNLNSEQKPKNFWQKLKVWQKAGIIFFAFLLIYVVIIPLLFCGSVNFSFTQDPEYIFCSRDSDCKITNCGCLNKKTVLKCGALVVFSNLFSLCEPPSSCSCQNGLCVSEWDYGNDIKKSNIEKEISLTTDKTECQTGEEVKLTIKNNLDKEIEFYNIAVEKFNNDEWQQIRFDIECLGLCEKTQTVINSQNDKTFLWDQKDSIGLQIEAGKFRFRIGVWDNTFIGNGLPPIFNYYSNEFTIKDNFTENKGLDYCQEDSNCEARFSHCNCKYNCVNKNTEIDDCAVVCNESGPILPKCICENNKCTDKKSLSFENLSAEDRIQDLIQQMGNDNISQEIKNAIPEKLYDYGKEAISYLIEALDDERVFNPRCISLSADSSADYFEKLIKEECEEIIRIIVTPSPYPKTAPIDKGYRFSFRIDNWQQWWEENQNKSLNEIRKMVRDWYRAEEEKNNYSATGYCGEEYDYLDFVGELFHDDWDWDSGQNCHGLNEVKQCTYLDWPISYGCRVADINNCYECFSEKNKDATICESIKSEYPARKDNCYWRLVVVLNKAGMNDKIDFCDKFIGKYKDAYKEECLKLVK